MVNTLQKPELKELHPNIKSPDKETLLTPRFYTTDFEALAKMDISINEEELKAILEEFRTDYNRYHFIRREEFSQTWDHFIGRGRGDSQMMIITPIIRLIIHLIITAHQLHPLLHIIIITIIITVITALFKYFVKYTAYFVL